MVRRITLILAARKFRISMMAVLVAMGLSVAAPAVVHADPYHRVCLASNSSAYSYLTLYAYSGTSYLNRGQCSSSSWNYVLMSFRPSAGMHCYDQAGRAYYSGTTYPSLGTVTLRCYSGSW